MTAPHPLWPSITTSLTLSESAFSAKSIDPRQTSPMTLPATRITNRSLNPWPNSISVGTLASEHPTTTANGACLGTCPWVRIIPTSRPLHWTTYLASLSEDLPVRQLSIHRENIRLPSSSVFLAAIASRGGFLTLGFLGSKR